MTEPTKCMDHLETDEGDFFCELAAGHDAPCVVTGEVAESIQESGKPETLEHQKTKKYRVEWTTEVGLELAEQKEG
jgi:hypothetical protein